MLIGNRWFKEGQGTSTRRPERDWKGCQIDYFIAAIFVQVEMFPNSNLGYRWNVEIWEDFLL